MRQRGLKRDFRAFLCGGHFIGDLFVCGEHFYILYSIKNCTSDSGKKDSFFCQ